MAEERIARGHFACRKDVVWLLDHYGVKAAPPRKGRELTIHPPLGVYTTVKISLADGVSETGAKLWNVVFCRYNKEEEEK